MGKWNTLTKSNLERHAGRSPKGFSEFSSNWAPICEMFGNKVQKHPWITNSTNKDLPVRILTPHHIISISSLDFINKTYRKILRESCYNVNHPKNLLLIPSKDTLACELRVPHHTTNHASWSTVDNLIPSKNIDKIITENSSKEISKGYHFMVCGKVRKEIKKIVKKCKNYKCQEILDRMDDLSKTINFDITIGKLKVSPNGNNFLPQGDSCGSVNCNRNHNFYKDPLHTRMSGMISGRLKTSYEIYK
ncbi:AHH domain-containing protein [Vibrio parahaemolyticus]|uniref:AHH domain-containing protein n=1 Tax=Vibrio parahaemolyticus TaxID=670 RepID=UPI0011210D60|nr:AHH domain-containing protein [Vibrio parahaemolyticus]EJG0990091.1 AHH domain-containing protein [Vibrio parahaemolyticus]EJG1072133.1 AHH domain-containing protein [Vibrio parahaemolyticus]QLE31076.1 hypothetical protein FDV78_11290 [Vibrio parahaemolyticus]TOD58969.1 hypothetical protein CGJ60_24400 [Vibrio parahaemolyticus]HCG9740766.1 AHH domain-containing protein [Vibrio parahaemolyticus]